MAGAARRIEAVLEAERDQLALWLPVALGAGIALWLALPRPAGWYAAMALLGGVALLGLAVGPGTRLGRSLLAGGLVALAGLLLIWFRADWVASPRIDRPRVAEVAGRIEAVERLPARELVRLTIATDPGLLLPPRLRLNIDEADLAGPVVGGSRIVVRARLLPPAPPAVPGAYDYARAAWFAGIGATGKALDRPRIAAGEAGGFLLWLADARARLSQHIEARVAGASAGGIAASLATGDQGAIAEEDAEALRRAGLAHLLSVSGLHVSAVVGGVLLLTLRLLALSPALALRAPLLLIAAGAGAVAGIAYTLLSGAQVPTIRSCVAALLVLAGIAMGREAITLRLVATGALVVLLLWPEALAGPSFQLSFAAVTALVALLDHPRVAAFAARREERLAARWGRAIAVMLLSGLLIEAALAPIALFHFHKSGLYGAAANIVAIPLTTFVIMPLEALALLLDVAGLGGPAWWLASHALALLLWIAHRVADAPGSVAMLPTMAWGAFALMVAGGLWLALWRTKLRRWGLAPLAVGALWALASPAPDLLVTGDGRHVALALGDGRVALLRERTGDYMRGVLSEAAGVDAEPLPFDALMQARCSADLCLAEINRGGRRWRILATRSPYLVDWRRMTRACAAADIAISERRLPRGCNPRWLKIDRPLLARTGGLSVDLDRGRIDSVAAHVGQHPWSVFR
ncbi:ComEC/Rec2 family competence protein [Rhizorhabdus dicambivorans]|uniref:Competence protein ComEC n=1 Tax=Rhizorhabdus dicambivorans TaxID=1850238 RepID=A0A2A4G070_9SPHN|nr:ComEC/Rec2 family competence protein [Rhizorhabdus dicambivorans]ATE67045.1 competence protein ComEC [Rhizorhabdus dicambivorans]PCE43387.1 competence protein ComEC [Rhizorhabdus dicambivorans]